MNADLYDLVSNGQAFTNPLTSLSGTSATLASTGEASTTFLYGTADTQIQAALAAGGLTPARLNAGKNMYTATATGVSTLTAYGDRSISEAYSRIGTSVSYKSGLKGIGREPDNCDLINKAFGVVQELGAQWLRNIETAISFVTEKMNALAALVQQGISAGLAKIQALANEIDGLLNQAISAVNQVIQDITQGIAAELAHIQSMIAECLNFSFANVISEWFKDSCAGAVIGKIGTPQLNNALK